jgi:hypothetical protein
MMQTKNLWGECQHCGGAMEFAADAVGTTAECPHCGQSTELMLALPPETESPVRTKAIIFVVVAVLILGGGLVGTVLVLKRAERLTAQQREAAANAPAKGPPPAADPLAQLGFSVSPVTLEKGQSDSLVHAVGKIRNTTNRQHFGVRVELELLDATGSKVGNATDYQATLEPQAEWRFHALVVEKKATSARIVAIKEDK